MCLALARTDTHTPRVAACPSEDILLYTPTLCTHTIARERLYIPPRVAVCLSEDILYLAHTYPFLLAHTLNAGQT
jgi:hypothetical protein